MNESRPASDVEIIIVVAVAENGVIGRDGDMPWRLSTDLKRFKALTMGKPVVMGRKTFQAIGKPLPGRANIVITRDASFRSDGIQVVKSVEEAIDLAQDKAREAGADAICIVGGGEIYRQALPMTDRVHLTHVEARPDGDTLFPDLDPDEWTVEDEQLYPIGPKDTAATRYVVYVRKSR